MRRSRSRLSKPGSMSSARSPSPTAWPRPRRWLIRGRSRPTSGVRSMVGFTYRRVPAIGLAQRLVAQGRIGVIRHVRAQYLQDWIVDPKAPLFWRLRREVAGSGALGDIGAHIIDLVQYITGEEITGLSAMTETFIKERPLPESTTGLSGTAGTVMGEVTVDDAAIFIARHGRRGTGDIRGDAVRHRTQERHPHRDQRVGRLGCLRLRGHEHPPLLRQPRRLRDRWVPPDPRHRGRASRTSRTGGLRDT